MGMRHIKEGRGMAEEYIINEKCILGRKVTDAAKRAKNGAIETYTWAVQVAANQASILLMKTETAAKGVHTSTSTRQGRWYKQLGDRLAA